MDLLSFIDSAGVQNFVGTEVDSSVDNMVGGTAHKIKGFLDDVLCDHERPVDHHFAEPSDNNEQQQQQQPKTKRNRTRQHQPVAAEAPAPAPASATADASDGRHLCV